MNDGNLSNVMGKNIDIKEIPDIKKYEDIITAAKTGTLVVFVGAGVSKLVGLPLWSEFALSRLDTIYENGLVDFRTYCDLKNIEPKKLLTICKMFMDENKIPVKPSKEIFEIRDKNRYKEVYEKLYSINAIYVTTNYDECLDNFALNKTHDINIVKESINDNAESKGILETNSNNREVIIKQSDLLESKLKNGNVIHIHGSVNNENEMIVTLNDYILHYGNLSKDNYPELSIFLDRVFNTKYVVLFVGYGLEEYEILEYMLSKVKNPQNSKSHYLLYSCYKEDYQLVNLLSKYYLGFGVELIPFDISKKGYNQLTDVIDNWASILKRYVNDQDYIQKTHFIDEVICEKTNRFDTHVRAVIDMISDDSSLESYLFQKISDVRWLNILHNNGFFNPERVPAIIHKESGSYKVPYWMQTEYLNKLLSNEDNLNAETIETLLNIIKKVSMYKDDNGNSIDNFHVWTGFAEVINKIPNTYINHEILDLLKVWTVSELNPSFVLQNISGKLIDKFLISTQPYDHEKGEYVLEIIFSQELEANIFKRIFTQERIRLVAEKCSMNHLSHVLNLIIELLYVEKNTVNINNSDLSIDLLDSRDKYVLIIKKDNINYKTLEIEYCSYIDYLSESLEWVKTHLDENELNCNFEEVLRMLYFNINSKCSYESLYINERSLIYSYDKLLIHYFKDLLLLKYKDEPKDNEKGCFLEHLLNNRYFAIKKIGLYIIGNLPDEYMIIFFNNLGSNNMKLIFEESFFGEELRVVLERINDAPLEIYESILQIIESGPYDKSYGNRYEEYNKIWKTRRLNALTHIQYFKEYIENKYGEISADVKLIPAISSVEPIPYSGKSPLTQADITKLSNNKLAQYLSSFREDNNWDSPRISGLGRRLKENVKYNSKKYFSNLFPFIDTEYYYVSEIIYGLKEAWEAKEFIDWNHVLEFVYCYIDREQFWNDSLKIENSYNQENYKWVLNATADLIFEGTYNYEWAMEPSLLNKAKDLCFMILYKELSFKEDICNSDYINHNLSSVKSRWLRVLLSIYLYKIPEKQINIWRLEQKNIFDEYLDAGVTDMYVFLGRYLPEFLNMDAEWTKDKINRITYDNSNWEGFMTGYLDLRTLYKDIYLLMKDHYKSSSKHLFKEEDTKERFAQHTALGYIIGYEEEINYEVYNSVIKEWNIDVIKYMISFYSYYYIQSYKEISERTKQNIIRDRIIKFWSTIYNKYKDETEKNSSITDDVKKMLSNSLLLIEYLDDIDTETACFIKLGTPYAEVNYNSTYVIDKLYSIITDDDSKEKRGLIGEILLDLVKYNLPMFDEEKIEILVRYLYECKDSEYKEIPDKICNHYVENGLEFLKDVYMEFRQW